MRVLLFVSHIFSLPYFFFLIFDEATNLNFLNILTFKENQTITDLNQKQNSPRSHKSKAFIRISKQEDAPSILTRILEIMICFPFFAFLLFLSVSPSYSYLTPFLFCCFLYWFVFLITSLFFFTLFYFLFWFRAFIPFSPSPFPFCFLIALFHLPS